MANLPNPHDALFGALLEDAERARDFLRDHIPNSIAGKLADDAPRIVDEALAGSQSDLLMKVRLKAGGDAFVYGLAEHTSQPSPALPIQLAGYMFYMETGRRHQPPQAARFAADHPDRGRHGPVSLDRPGRARPGWPR